MSEEIAMNEAVRRAISTVKELLAGDEIRNVALEEIESEKGMSGDWLVTVGYDAPKAVQERRDAVGALQAAFFRDVPPETERKYKIMRINRHGGFVSMKIRDV